MMKFELIDREGFVPDLHYGEPGRELACFIPEHAHWQQLSYANGEGQVLIDGHQWGFYHAPEGICVVLHSGVTTMSEAAAFVGSVKDRIYGEKAEQVQMLIVGEEVAH